ncbi:MAG: 2-oxo acid dehydrogenase subunit E2 [Actinomycetia bacterium]|nr:2-oxo acid dehydrogenase subunit E2 [Actinomycetes bacterium]
MGGHVVKVPDVGEGVAEVELVAWFVTVGETVGRNQVLAEVMTDKANVEIPSPVDGVVASLSGELGEKMAVGSPLMELAIDGEAPDLEASVSDSASPATATTDPSLASASASDPGVATAPVVVPALTPAAASAPGTGPAPVPASLSGGPSPVVGGVPRPPGERPRATPAVRHRAREAGVDLRQVRGTGPAGRITHTDLDAYLNRGPLPASPAGGRQGVINESVHEQPIIGIRRHIAERMVASATSIPHITYVEEVDVTALEDLRATLNERRQPDQTRLTFLPFMARALVTCLPRFPKMNAHVDDERGVMTTYGAVNVGVATQTDNGLLVPVVHHAEADSIWTLAQRIADLAEATRAGKANPADLRGSTITITSLGALGGLATTPVINKPEVAIVGVNKIAVRPVWIDGAFVPRKMMNLSSSFDHRVIDGWDAATFVQELRAVLEQPALLFVDES